MRGLLDSSWMKFGPAGRASYDWVTGTPTAAAPERQLQGLSWGDLDPAGEARSRLLLCAGLPLASLLVLALLVLAIRRRRRRLARRGELTVLADVVSLDVQDADGSAADLLDWEDAAAAAAERRRQRHASGGSDASDGVLLVVYLPPPPHRRHQQRALSVCGSGDACTEDLEARLCPDGRFV